VTFLPYTLTRPASIRRNRTRKKKAKYRETFDPRNDFHRPHRKHIGNEKFRNSVTDDVQLGVVVAAVLASLDRHVPAYEPDGGSEETRAGHETEM